MNNDDNRFIFVGVGICLIVAIIIGGVWWNYSRRIQISGKGNMTQTIEKTDNELIESAKLSGKPWVKITTTSGSFIIELRPDLAPKTVANFLEKFSTGFCKGLTFHRVEDWVVQGCDPVGNGTGGNTNLPTEISKGDFGIIGAVGVARRPDKKDVSNDSQFFIVKTPAEFLNGDYTYFGQVVEGLDIIMKIKPQEKIIDTLILSK